MSNSNDKAGIAATQEDVLPRGFTLLGTTLTDTVNRALFRTGAGRVVSREVGDRVDGRTLVSIDMGEVTLSRGGQTKVIRIAE